MIGSFFLIGLKYLNFKKKNRIVDKSNISSEKREKVSQYNVYYGHLHNHSNVSDGKGSPADAYKYARDVAGLDFFSLADHDGFSKRKWNRLKRTAKKYNEEGKFIAFWGFEWSSETYGHVTVINTDDYVSSKDPKANNFKEFASWLSKYEGVAFFNHPGRNDSSGKEFEHFGTMPNDKFVGIELWNKNQAFETYYYNDGYNKNDKNKGYYDEANLKGWKIGAAGAEDNHKATWGTDVEYKLAVLAKDKTKKSIYDSIKDRRFFSTTDKNIGLSFELNNLQMGSVINKGTFDAIIKANDVNMEKFTKVIIYKNGEELYNLPVDAESLDVKQSVKTESGEYYYVKITQKDGDEAISSPIYIN